MPLGNPRRMSFLSSSCDRFVRRLAVLAVLAVAAGTGHAASPDASQSAVRKTEPVSESLKSVLTRTAKRLAAIPDLKRLASHSVLIVDAASGETLYSHNAAVVTPIAS